MLGVVIPLPKAEICFECPTATVVYHFMLYTTPAKGPHKS